MSSDPGPIYSQGFNFGSLMQKGVDPRTGQYTCAIDIYKAPSDARNCPPFKLSLTFNPLNTENIGFGQGWSFSLPSIEHRQERPTVILSTGESFRAAQTASSIYLIDQKLKSFQFKELEQRGHYQFTYKSGQVEILSNFNDSYNKTVLVESYSHIGRSLSFSWASHGEQPRLEKVLQGGSDVLLEIEYGVSHADITLAPGTSEACTFTLTQTNDQLSELSLPLPDASSWKFGYEKYGEMIYLDHVTSPSGLVEEMLYTEQGHRLPVGAPFESIPYVTLHTAHPGVGQPSIKTHYNYSDNNFLAYNGGNHWVDGEDNLYLMPNDYEYSSTVQVEGGSQTTHAYNKFHLLVRSEQQKGTNQVIQTTTYYALPSTGFDEQPPQYLLPKIVETTYRCTVSDRQRKETSEYVFDEWGNPTQEVQPNGVKTNRLYYPPTGETGPDKVVNCPPDPHGFQRYIKTETVTPASSSHAAPTRGESYLYRQLPTATGGKATHFVAVRRRQTLEGSKVLTTTDYDQVNQPATRDHGRPRQEITRLFDQHPTTKDWTYVYPSSSQLAQTVTTKTFDGFIVKEETGYSLRSGLISTHKNEAGVIEQLSYDAIGRLIRLTTSPGTRYQTVLLNKYAILGARNGSQKTVTDAKGVETRYTTDGMERLCRVEKQDVETSNKPFRLIQEHSYNAQDQRSATAEIDWLRSEDGKGPTEQRSSKSMAYDDWGNVEKVTESGGLITLSVIDPITRTKIEGIEGKGEGTVKTQLNIFGAPTQVALHKSDKDSTLYSKVNYTYDGLGRLVNQKDHRGRTTEYKYDSFDRINETIWPNNRVVKTQYASHTTAALPESMQLNGSTVGEQSVDGLGRLTSRQVGARTVSQSYQGISPEPNEITSPKGVKFSLEYEPALGYAVRRLAGSGLDDNYEYDPQTGALSQHRCSYSTHDLDYAASGLISQEDIKIAGDQSFPAHFVYSMAGKLQQYTDALGQKHKLHYDAIGRLQRLEQDKLKVSFVYDKASRVSETHVEDTGSDAKIKTTLSYDDFGRELKRFVYNGKQTLLYHLTLTYNELGLVHTRVQENGQGVLRDESFEYDSHNRLTDYACQGSQLPKDQHGNPLRSQHFKFDAYDNITECSTAFQDGSTNTAVYSFSEQDPTQLTGIANTHSDYPSRVDLDYDENGCLKRDERGRKLEYNSMSRLTAVRDANDEILAQYQYDASGKLVGQQVPDQPDTYFFYRGDSLIAVKKGDQKVSYLSDGSETWGETISRTSQGGATTESKLWALDSQHSILAAIDAQQPEQTSHQQYTPYCFSNVGDGDGAGSTPSSLGFNGQWRDPVTGYYHLGNGYRIYNPNLMRFHSPDPWSPFTSGEINPYSYCLGDPINRVDPSGHFSIFGIKFGWKFLITTVAAIAVSVGVGILTGGASLAIQIGVGIAAGVVTDVVSGMIGDAVEGNSITWKSVGMDALGGLVGGVAGTVGGQALKSTIKATKAAPMALAKVVGRAGSATITKSAVSKTLGGIVKSSARGFARGFIPAQAASRAVAAQITKSLDAKSSASQQSPQTQLPVSYGGGGGAPSRPLGRSGPTQVGSQPFYFDKASFKPRDIIRPAMKDGDDGFADVISTSMSIYGAESGLGQSAVAHLLNRDVRFIFTTSSPSMAEDSEE